MTCGCRQVNPKMAQNLIAALQALHTKIDAHVSNTKPKTRASLHMAARSQSPPQNGILIFTNIALACPGTRSAVSGPGSGCCGPAAVPKHGCLVQQHDHRGVPCCCGRHPPPALLDGALVACTPRTLPLWASMLGPCLSQLHLTHHQSLCWCRLRQSLHLLLQTPLQDERTPRRAPLLEPPRLLHLLRASRCGHLLYAAHQLRS